MHFANPADEGGQGVAEEDQTLRVGRRFVEELVAGVAQIRELEGGKPLGTRVDVHVIQLTEPVQEGEPNVFSPLELFNKRKRGGQRG